jgi:hypothetical protein
MSLNSGCWRNIICPYKKKYISFYFTGATASVCWYMVWLHKNTVQEKEAKISLKHP